MARIVKTPRFYEASVILHLHNGTTWRHDIKGYTTIKRDLRQMAHRWAKKALHWPPTAHQYNGIYEVIIRQEGKAPLEHKTHEIKKSYRIKD